jgi:AraC-like DNA-binding protein
MESTFWRVPELQLECIKVAESRHCFPRHFHATYVIEVVEGGRNEFWCDGHIYSAEPNDIIVIHPGDIHTGYPAGFTALSYRSFYPTKNLMASVQKELYDNPDVPRFRSCVVHDFRLSEMFRQAHILMEGSHSGITGRRLFILALKELVKRYSSRSIARKEHPFTSNRIKPALDFLADSYQNNISLMDLSTFCGLSEYHFIRTFKRLTGLAPYQYVIATRIEESRKLLSEGMSIAEAAVQTGFCDQSHLSRHFKRLLGITPGKYAHTEARQRDPMQL